MSRQYRSNLVTSSCFNSAFVPPALQGGLGPVLRASSSTPALCKSFKLGRPSLSPPLGPVKSVKSLSMRTPKQGGKSSASSKPRDPVTTKHRLLKILASLINLDSQHGKVEELILQLESLNVRPVTDTFTEMALSGAWRLLFSSMRTKPDGSIRIREIGQVIDAEKKTLTNQVLWSFPSADGALEVRAYLWVICQYKFTGPGRLEVSIMEHKVKILEPVDGQKPNLPEDLQGLIKTLQRALPFDFFDPSGLLDVSYIEPNFRIARFMGKGHAGVRNVFVRVGTEG